MVSEKKIHQQAVRIFQAIDRDGTASICPFSRRRPCDAFSNWRTLTAGTGRLNR
jgi:hypothetical protein